MKNLSGVPTRRVHHGDWNRPTGGERLFDIERVRLSATELIFYIVSPETKVNTEFISQVHQTIRFDEYFPWRTHGEIYSYFLKSTKYAYLHK